MPKTALPPLDKLDPEKAWQPWQPDATHPWNLKWAGHLYRRAGFGAGLTELREAVDAGLHATLQRVVRTAPKPSPSGDAFHQLGKDFFEDNDAVKLRNWWLLALLNTRNALREKMTLFWHNHFATSIKKVQRAGLMFEQFNLLRRYALINFRPLLLAISQDPAMLIWLDSNSNVRGNPNENYARELMELFSLGVGNYSERDVREAARAFTGWHVVEGTFKFSSFYHDDGQKTVLKQTGAWDGDDIVRIVLEQPAAARFLTRKFYRFFVSEAVKPPDQFLKPLADAFRLSDYDVAGLVKTMLSSQHFFSGYAYRQRIKSPIEFVIGTLQSLADDEEVTGRPEHLAPRLEAMGQELFAPPNVKGWVGGQAWLNTASMLTRLNFLQALFSESLAVDPSEDDGTATNPSIREGDASGVSFKPDSAVDPVRIVKREEATNAEAIVRVLAQVHLQGDISPAACARLKEFVAEGNPKGPDLEQRIREASHAIMSMPEYQLA